MTEDLDKQMQDISKKLQERDQAARKQAEQEWRKEMERDTAGHMLKMFGYVQAQLASFQAQIDATNPLAPLIRTIDAVVARLTDINVRLERIEKGEKA